MELLDWLDSKLLRPEVAAFLVTLFGSAAMYVFTVHRGYPGAVEFLRKMFPGRSDSFYNRLDFLIVVVIGGAIGYIFFAPKQPIQALAAGFGWVGAVNVLIGQSDPPAGPGPISQIKNPGEQT